MVFFENPAPRSRTAATKWSVPLIAVLIMSEAECLLKSTYQLSYIIVEGIRLLLLEYEP